MEFEIGGLGIQSQWFEPCFYLHLTVRAHVQFAVKGDEALHFPHRTPGIDLEALQVDEQQLWKPTGQLLSSSLQCTDPIERS